MSGDHHHRVGSGGQRELFLALCLTITMTVIELTVGWMSRSLSLLADGGHMLTDASALALGLFASWIATRPATPEKTYGYYRTEILAALINGVALWLLVIFIYIQAFRRLSSPTDVDSVPMLATACLGLVVNLFSSRLLLGAKCQTLNIQAARVHVVSDALGSLGVLVAGALVHWKGWTIADPIASIFIGILIAISSWDLVRRSVNVLLEGTPAHLNLGQISEAVCGVPGVRDVHDLHCWTISTGLDALSGHIVVDNLSESAAILAAINRVLEDRFRVTHTTIQLESSARPCHLAAPHHH